MFFFHFSYFAHVHSHHSAIFCDHDHVPLLFHYDTNRMKFYDAFFTLFRVHTRRFSIHHFHQIWHQALQRRGANILCISQPKLTLMKFRYFILYFSCHLLTGILFIIVLWKLCKKHEVSSPFILFKIKVFRISALQKFLNINLFFCKLDRVIGIQCVHKKIDIYTYIYIGKINGINGKKLLLIERRFISNH